MESNLDVRSISSKRWRLLADYTRVTRDGRPFTVQAGDTTDFASIPWWTQSLLPRTGTWTKASVAHDKRCDLLNAVHKDDEAKLFFDWWWEKAQPNQLEPPPLTPPPGWFNSVDTDRIFYEDVRDDGTDWVRAELLWLGVRWGALWNASRREGWLSTAPRVLLGTVMVLALLFALVTIVSVVWPW